MIFASSATLLQAASRFGAAIIGSYAFAYGFVAIVSLACVAAGSCFADAQSLAFMLGLIVYLAALLWAFVPRSAGKAWLVLGGGGFAMGAAAWTLSRAAAG